VRQQGRHERWGGELEWMIRWWKVYGEYIWDKSHNVHRFEVVLPTMPAGMPAGMAGAGAGAGGRPPGMSSGMPAGMPASMPSALPPMKKISADVVSRAWYAAMVVTLTGEDEVRDGPIAPRRPFSPFSDCCHGWGAWELGARYEQFRVNEEPFEKEVVRGANKVDAWTIGLNWYPTVHVRFQANVYHADFNKDLSFLTPDRLFRKETAYIFLAQYYY
jgi:hypothetical protein